MWECLRALSAFRNLPSTIGLTPGSHEDPKSIRHPSRTTPPGGAMAESVIATPRRNRGIIPVRPAICGGKLTGSSRLSERRRSASRIFTKSILSWTKPRFASRRAGVCSAPRPPACQAARLAIGSLIGSGWRRRESSSKRRKFPAGRAICRKSARVCVRKDGYVRRRAR